MGNFAWKIIEELQWFILIQFAVQRITNATSLSQFV